MDNTFKKIKVAFFSEAGNKRGFGHLIRDYTIYSKFKSIGVKASFFLDSDIDFGYKFNGIKSFSWKNFKLIDTYDIIFIDSYEAKLDIYKTISNSCKVAVYIDDYKRLSYPKGVIINFSPDANEIFYKQKKDIYTYLLGLKYIPIREQFFNLKVAKKNQTFIMLGGSDIANLSFKVCQALKDTTSNIVLVTNNYEDIMKLENIHNINILFKPSDKELITAMAASSLAIITASMTAYELAYLNIPTIIIAVSKDQKIGASALIKHNIASKYISIKNKNWLQELATTKIEIYKTNCLIDDKGTQRIVNKILGLLK